MVLEDAQYSRVVRENNREWDEQENDDVEDTDHTVPVTNCPSEHEMSEDDLARHDREPHPVKVKCLSFGVNGPLKRILGDREAPETPPVCEEEHDEESTLHPLDEAVPSHAVVLTQSEGEERLVVLVQLPTNLLLIPHVEAVLGQQSGVGKEKEIVDEVVRREASLGVKEEFGGSRNDRLLNNDADEEGDIVSELASVPEQQPPQVLKLADREIGE